MCLHLSTRSRHVRAAFSASSLQRPLVPMRFHRGICRDTCKIQDISSRLVSSCRAQLVARSRTTPQATWDEVDDAVYGPSDAGKESGDWAHLIARPEIGCVLLANPLLFNNSQTYFDKAVILVIDSSEQGSMGIILNKPSELRLKNMEDVVLENRFRIFAQNKVYLGGDVDGDGLYLLHEHGVPGAQQVCQPSTPALPLLPVRLQRARMHHKNKLAFTRPVSVQVRPVLGRRRGAL